MHKYSARRVACSLVVALGLGLVSLAATPTAGPTFQRGVNISHWLSQNFAGHPYAAPDWFNESDVAWIAQQGFDHIRLPVDIRTCLAADGSLDEAKLAPVRAAIGWARAHHLALVLDAHFLPGADFNTEGGDNRVYTDPPLMEKVAGIWRDLARRFAGEGPDVRFEILNEPVAPENRQLNPFMHRMLAAIRESNPTRIVYVTSNRWSGFGTLPDVVLPDDKHIALTLHNYEPFVFTHQRAAWAGFKPTMPAVPFPGPVPDLTGHAPDYIVKKYSAGTELTVAEMEASFDKVAAWVQAHAPGIEVYVGEFGVYQVADAASKRHWVSAMVHGCERRGWGWAVWDYKGGFAIRDAAGHGTPVLDGLFAK